HLPDRHRCRAGAIRSDVQLRAPLADQDSRPPRITLSRSTPISTARAIELNGSGSGGNPDDGLATASPNDRTTYRPIGTPRVTPLQPEPWLGNSRNRQRLRLVPHRLCQTP